MQIQCENPAIILNPHVKELVLKYRHYYINDKRYSINSSWYSEFPYHKLNKAKKYFTASSSYPEPIDINSCYIVDADGVTQPLFIQVPCDKCVLCRDKKAKDWATRAMCESQYSSSIPLFITLTYNDLCLPSNGVRKGAAQRFMKRLRVNLERYTKQKSNIRYFLCSEYGSKTCRPHYHALIWNFPVLNAAHIHDIIQKSWSFQVTKEYYDKVPNKRDEYGKLVFKYYDKDKDTYRHLYGYVYVSQITEGRVRYCMKYMRKDGNTPEKCNKVFFLSSRRNGGIGSQWIKEHAQMYRDNPQLVDVKITDIWSSEPYIGGIPRYYKDYIAPPPSKIVKKEIRDKLKDWQELSNQFHAAIGHHYEPNRRVLDKYPFFIYYKPFIYKHPRLPQVKPEHDVYTRDLANKITSLEQELLSYTYDLNLAISTPKYKDLHLMHITDYIATLPDVPVKEKAAAITRHRSRLRALEVF